jgi:hypothetical protein
MRNPVKSNAQLINYSHHSKYPICICNPVIEKSFSSQTNNANISNNMRISNMLTSKYSTGGRIQVRRPFLYTESFLGPRNKF